jgi:CBS domain containing-hemolysin-like protein
MNDLLAILAELSPWLALLVVLLGCSAFVSGSEAALFSLSRVDLDALAERSPRAGEAVKAMLEDPRRLIATLLLGSDAVNVMISAIGVHILVALGERGLPVPLWANVVVITPLLLVFGEITPKAVAVRLAPAWARFAARPIGAFGFVVSPIRALLAGVSSGILRALGQGPEPDQLGEAMREAQFKALVALGAKDGALAPDEARLIQRVLELTDTPVSRLMTPRAEVVSVSIQSPYAQVLEQTRASRFSRIPVWLGEPDNIRGILLSKDLLRFKARPADFDARSLESLLKPAYFVPPGKSAGQLLREFQKNRGHMALVIDEYGSLLGLVTMQDLLEQLFDPFVEELDERRVPVIERISDGVYRVPARTDVAEWNRLMHPPIPPGPTYSTLAGYVFHRLGRLPRKGEQVQDAGWIFHVSGVEGTRMTALTVTRRLPAALPGGAPSGSFRPPGPAGKKGGAP